MVGFGSGGGEGGGGSVDNPGNVFPSPLKPRKRFWGLGRWVQLAGGTSRSQGGRYNNKALGGVILFL